MRNKVIKLLDKVGANYTEKISADRAVAKLLRYLDKEGMDDVLSTEEIFFVERLRAGAEQTPKETPTEKPATTVQEGVETMGTVPQEETPKEEKPKAQGRTTTGKKENKPKPKAEKEVKQKGEKKGRMSWIECAAKSVLREKTLSQAALATKELFQKEHNGKQLRANVLAPTGIPIYVKSAAKVLIMVGKIEVTGDKIKHL